MLTKNELMNSVGQLWLQPGGSAVWHQNMDPFPPRPGQGELIKQYKQDQKIHQLNRKIVEQTLPVPVHIFSVIILI